MPLRICRLKITAESPTMKLIIHFINKHPRMVLRHSVINIFNGSASEWISGNLCEVRALCWLSDHALDFIWIQRKTLDLEYYILASCHLRLMPLNMWSNLLLFFVLKIQFYDFDQPSDVDVCAYVHSHRHTY